MWQPAAHRTFSVLCFPRSKSPGFPRSVFWRRKWHPTPVLLPGEPCGQRSLVGCCPRGHTESDTTQATWHACIGEGNGTPLQCSCLENPRDGGAWWAAVYGVAQSRTRLKRLSSSLVATSQREPLRGLTRHQGPVCGQTSRNKNVAGGALGAGRGGTP